MSEAAPHRAAQSDLHALLRTLWRWKFLIIILALIPPVYASMSGQQIVSVYTADVKLSVGSTRVDPQTGQLVSYQPQQEAIGVTQSFKIEEVYSRAAKILGIEKSEAAAIAGGEMMKVTVELGTSIVTVAIADKISSERAAEKTNAFIKALQQYRQKQLYKQIDGLVAGINKQIASAPLSSREALKQQRAKLKSIRLTEVKGGLEVYGSATPGPKVTQSGGGRSMALAIFLGILMGVGAALLAEQLDRRIRTADELERVSGVRLLAVVPSDAFAGGPDKTGYVTQAIELLRASIWAFHHEKPIRTLVMLSTRQGDGKTTVSVSLARAIARAGRTVTLIDADLRHPQVAARLGIEPGPGLTGVLTKGVPLEEAVLSVDHDPGIGGALTVLPAGSVASHPAELIASAGMTTVIETLMQYSEIILIDTPAAMATSDALPLLARADGTIVVSRLRRTRYAALKRLLVRIDDSHGRTIGVVATGAKGASGYERYSYKAYGNRHWYDRLRFWDQV